MFRVAIDLASAILERYLLVPFRHAHSSKMDELRLGHETNLISFRRNAATKVDVFKIHEELFVEATDPSEKVFWNHKRRPRYPVYTLRQTDVVQRSTRASAIFPACSTLEASSFPFSDHRRSTTERNLERPILID